MRKTLRLTLLACLSLYTPCLSHADDDPITLERIMADPDWIGNRPRQVYWADDGKSVYYQQKRVGEQRSDLIQIDLDGNVIRTVADGERGMIDVPGGDWSGDWTWKVYAHQGDLFFKNIVSGKVRQLTRTRASESDPRFMVGDTRITFRRGDAILIRDIPSGLEYQPVELRFEKDPGKAKKDKSDYLNQQQERLFNVIRERKQRKDENRDRQKKQREIDRTQVPPPWYLGSDVQLGRAVLSPNGAWMLLRLIPNPRKPGKSDTMANFVTESGYVETRNVRTKVGSGHEGTDTLALLDLTKHVEHRLSFDGLPLIRDDPLRELREQARARRRAKREAGQTGTSSEARPAPSSKPTSQRAKPRPVALRSFRWSDDGSRALLQIFSRDNKDRWIAIVDPASDKKLIPLEHERDQAWINRYFVTAGWMPDGKTIWFLSERDGYSHLYVRSIDEPTARQLTRGRYVVSNVHRSRDGRYLYYQANVEHPGVYEAYRVNVESGEIEPLTHLGGRNVPTLSPDEKNLLVIHSTTTHPQELYIQPLEPGAAARQVTHTVTPEFLALPWVEPRIVEVPSRNGRPIYSRLYLPENGSAGGARPAVMFVHGAGYLQNAHAGWSNYFREFMFHTLLVRRGYVVLDMDYRASAGYGRDWRTAIYRRMGEPELEDLENGVHWLVKRHNVDPKRVGVYGGSYGGFLTLMALFNKGDLFACGAALRPVTDWAHYNHGYTSNILNTPQVDPEAYERSSPIEFANGLNKPLLICHGMQDDNVFFQDTVRLAQRLIELKKQNWEVAIFPVEPHGFREPTSWLNEYRRIYKLFETNLRR